MPDCGRYWRKVVFMSHDSLNIKISPTLLESLGLPRDGESIDYFMLIGVEAGRFSPQDIDAGVLERSRVLRQWQTSPQYGKEVIRLLGILHRSAKILKDPKRCAIYREELEREVRGEKDSSLKQFESLARAALVGQFVDQDTHEQIRDIARSRGIHSCDAGETATRIRDEMWAARTQKIKSADQNDNWEFRFATKGIEGLTLTLNGLETAGNLNRQSINGLLEDPSVFKLEREQVAACINHYCVQAFDRMVSLVANNRAVNQEQALLLMPHAEEMGLPPAKAHEIISNYSFTAHSVEDLYGGSEISQTQSFDLGDIDQIVEVGSQSVRNPPLLSVMIREIPNYMRHIILVMLCLVVGIYAITFARLKNKSGPTSVDIGIHPVRIPAVHEPVGGQSKPVQKRSKHFLAPSISLVHRPKFPSRVPLTPDKMILLEPENNLDPPAFSIYAHEVTNEEYQQFINNTFDPTPIGWTDRRYPSGTGSHPVSGVSWDQARSYIKWLALKNGLDQETIQLPSHREYLRALRGLSIRGNPGDQGYWKRARLGGKSKPQPVMSVLWDEIYFAGIGQVHNLVGNVAEWTRDGDGPLMAGIAGGDYQQESPEYNHLILRYINKKRQLSSVGFRYVINLPN